MILIHQRTDRDCVLACLAMYVGKSYEEVLEVVHKEIKPCPDRDGLNLDEAVSYLRRFCGVPARRSVHFFPGEKAILDVPSLNNVGGMHAVYWDGKEVWDPQSYKPGKLFWTDKLLDAKATWASTITTFPIEDEPPLCPVAESKPETGSSPQ